MKLCIYCKSELVRRKQVKFCSNRCQIDNRYQKYIQDWKNGKVTGIKGILAKGISGHIKHYLLDKFKNKCSVCNWNIKHPVTKIVPLEIDHIDGNSENSLESNLL